MVTNTLLIKLKDRENADQAKATLLSMEGKIDALRDIQVEIDISRGPASYDILLVTRFATMEDMKIYLAHPVHVEVSKYIVSVMESSAAVCYEN